MKSVKFFNGQATQAEEYNDAQQYKADAILERFKDVRTPGIVQIRSHSPIVITDTAKKQLMIYGFTAYDSNNERIYLPILTDDESGTDSESSYVTTNGVIPTLMGLGMDPGTDDSNRTVSKTGGLFAPGTWTFVVRYTTITTGPISYHVTSGEPHPTRVLDSYTLICRKGGNSQIEGDVVLATLTVDGDNKISVDESVQKFSTIIENMVSVNSNFEEGQDGYGGNISLLDHINAVGTGTVSSKNPHGLSPADIGIDVGELANHQALCHVDGIRSDDISSTLSALYPYFHRETSSNEEYVYIRGLSSALREIVVANGVLIPATSIPNTYSYSFETRAAANYIGYYLFAIKVDTVEIVCLGPFTSDSDSTFQGYLNNSNYFPICSCKWDVVNYDYNQDGVIDKMSYDIIPGTFKDRRVFNNTSLANFRPDQAFALSQFAPICNDMAYIHNARVVSTLIQTDYDVVGKTLVVKVDGGYSEYDSAGSTITVRFASGNQYMQIEEVADQLNTAFTTINENGDTVIVAYARVTDEGALSISAPTSIELDAAASNDAREALGFNSASKNLSNTSNLVKELIYIGDRNGVVLFTYGEGDTSDSSTSTSVDDIIRIDYYLGGGVRRYNTFTYRNDIIVAVKEGVEFL